LPSALTMLVWHHPRVHRIPASRILTIAIRPSSIEAGCANYTADFQNSSSDLFFRKGLDRNSRERGDLPDRQSHCASHSAIVHYAELVWWGLLSDRVGRARPEQASGQPTELTGFLTLRGVRWIAAAGESSFLVYPIY